jgi:hypothetical protein
MPWAPLLLVALLAYSRTTAAQSAQCNGPPTVPVPNAQFGAPCVDGTIDSDTICLALCDFTFSPSGGNPGAVCNNGQWQAFGGTCGELQGVLEPSVQQAVLGHDQSQPSRGRVAAENLWQYKGVLASYGGLLSGPPEQPLGNLLLSCWLSDS